MQDLSAQHAKDAEHIDQLEQRIADLEQQTQQQNAQIEAISQALEGVQIRLPSPKSSSTKKSSASRLVQKINQAEAAIQQATQPADASEDEKNIYTAAYLALKSGRYDEASLQFAQLLEKFPKGEYSDQAWYWLGESLFAQRKTTKAIEALDHVVRNYPDSIKHASALLRLGQIYQENKRPGDAKAVYERLLREHGDSPLAEQARNALQSINAALKREK
ncbi:MAG TPA: tol-pal system protein YbgF [Mariprofundaceae bacterium]|nr:tol-pal system protein YbgF [Mariprofundaceae bacterium]